MMAEAEEKSVQAATELSAAQSERAQASQAAATVLAKAKTEGEAAAKIRRAAETAKAEAELTLRRAEEERTALAAREESIMIGTQAIIARELAYAPPTPDRAEALTWGENRPESKERRTWLSEKVKPARDWLVGFARTLFGYEAQKQAENAAQTARAQAIVDAERQQGRRPPQTMLDIIKGKPLAAGEVIEIPGAWSVPEAMTPEQIDAQLRSMSNAALCDAWAPTRDARDFAEHDKSKRSGYGTALDHLAKEATRRGLDLELREHRPEKATDAERARLHKDSPPRPLQVLRRDPDRVRSR